jgi:uncharacterized protein (UPF0332 family)
MANIIDEFLEFWVIPEIKKRQEVNEIPTPFVLSKAQVLFYAESDKKTIIRLNDEVKAILRAKLKNPATYGDIILLDKEIEEIDSINLPENEKDAAHITLISLKNVYYLYFDFVYNKTLVMEHIKRGEEFIISAEKCLIDDKPNACVELLWSGVEILAKAFLLTMPDPNIKTTKKHTYIKQHFNCIGQKGLSEYTALLNDMYKLRNIARYMTPNTSINLEKLNKYINQAKKFQNLVSGYSEGRATALN